MKDARNRGAVLIATIMEESAEAIERALAQVAAQGADAAEVRLDAAPGVAPEDIGRGAKIPLLASCRAARDGGAFRGSEEQRVGLLRRAAQTRRFLLDVEWGSAAESLQKECPAAIAVLSHHDCAGTPPAAELEERARALLAATRPGQVAKLVTSARHVTDILALRALLGSFREGADGQVHACHSAERDPPVHGIGGTAQAREHKRGGAAAHAHARAGSALPWPWRGDDPAATGGPYLAAFAMGEPGRASRVLAGAWGSAAVWAAARADAPGAPGQIDIGSLLDLYRFRSLTGATRVYGVAGSPISGSLSPAIHNAAFAWLGVDAVYVPLDCARPEDLVTMVQELPLAGASVTAPLKIGILSYLALVNACATEAGACNTVLRRARPELGPGPEGAEPARQSCGPSQRHGTPGAWGVGAGTPEQGTAGARPLAGPSGWRVEGGAASGPVGNGGALKSRTADWRALAAFGFLEGFNTDGQAVIEEIRARVDPAGRPATIIGAGGAARAAAFALRRAGSRLTIASRDPSRGAALALAVGGRSCAISELQAEPEAVIIHATSAALEDPVVSEHTLRALLVLDMRYGVLESALLAAARRAGTPAFDGLGMLVRQAAAQVRLFTGRDVPLEVLFEAVRAARAAPGRR